MNNTADTGMIKLMFSDQVPEAVEAGVRIMENSPALRKQASATFDCSLDELKPDKDHVGIHLVALGDTEHYGLNRNKDGFPKKACAERHGTFVRHGAVFEHHNNRDRDKNMGAIVKSAYNEPMGRIELFIHAHKEKAAEHLTRLEKTGEVSVSMAAKVPRDRCYPAGAQVLTPTGHEAIEAIEPGDVVVSHTGKACKVTHVHSSTYTGALITLGVCGIGSTTLTANHPIFVVPRAKLRAASGRRYKLRPDTNYVPMYNKDLGDVRDSYKLVAAEGVMPGDGLLVPVPLLPSSGVPALDPGLYVAGVYAGDGYLMKQRRGRNKKGEPYVVGFGLSVGMRDKHLAQVKRLASALCGDDVVKVYAESYGRQAVRVEVRDRVVAHRLSELAGEYSYTKRVDLSKFKTKEQALSFLGGLIDSDGSQDKRCGAVRILTVSPRLARDVHRLCLLCGVFASVAWAPTPRGTSGFKHTRGGMWSVHIGRGHVNALVPYAAKLDAVTDARAVHNYQRWGDYLVTTVNRATVAQVLDLPVYNLTVACDETYIADGAMTHNCTICGNFRKSASDPNQCEHIRDDFGRTYADGREVGTQNDEPTWFDISFVSRPADRIAWSLKTAGAARVEDAVKAAADAGIWVPDELEADVPGYSEKLALVKQLSKAEADYLRIAEAGVKTAADRYLNELLKSATCSIPDAIIDQLRAERPADVLRKLAACGVVMDADSFFKYAFGLDYGDVADSMPAIRADIENALFSRLHKSGAYQKVCCNNYFDVDNVNTVRYGLGRLRCEEGVKAASVACSFRGDSVKDRIVNMTIQGFKPTVIKRGSCVESGAAPGGGACVYAAYKLSAVRSIGLGGEESGRAVALAVAQNMVNKTGE